MVTATKGRKQCVHKTRQGLTICHGIADARPSVGSTNLLVLMGDWYRFFRAIRMNPNAITFVATKVGMFSKIIQESKLQILYGICTCVKIKKSSRNFFYSLIFTR